MELQSKSVAVLFRCIDTDGEVRGVGAGIAVVARHDEDRGAGSRTRDASHPIADLGRAHRQPVGVHFTGRQDILYALIRRSSLASGAATWGCRRW